MVHMFSHSAESEGREWDRIAVSECVSGRENSLELHDGFAGLYDFL